METIESSREQIEIAINRLQADVDAINNYKGNKWWVGWTCVFHFGDDKFDSTGILVGRGTFDEILNLLLKRKTSRIAELKAELGDFKLLDKLHKAKAKSQLTKDTETMSLEEIENEIDEVKAKLEACKWYEVFRKRDLELLYASRLLNYYVKKKVLEKRAEYVKKYINCKIYTSL